VRGNRQIIAITNETLQQLCEDSNLHYTVVGEMLGLERTHLERILNQTSKRYVITRSQYDAVVNFGEKNQTDAGWINGGFFVLEPGVAKYVLADSEPFESGALPRLVAENQLMAYHHENFWQPMDTLREKQDLAKLALLNTPPWLDFKFEKVNKL
jgi:NDP-sugar pyrophosphorylase family protein